MGDSGGGAEGGLGRRWVEQIAFQINNPRAGNGGLVQISLPKGHAGAKEGVHGALAIRAHQNQATCGGRTAGQRRGWEMDAGGGDVVAEHLAQPIIRDFPKIADLRAKPGCHRAGIGRRPAAAFNPRAHGGVNRLGLVGADQRHAALGHAVFGQEAVLGTGQHIHNGIADAKNIKAGGGHGLGSGKGCGGISLGRGWRPPCPKRFSLPSAKSATPPFAAR